MLARNRLAYPWQVKNSDNTAAPYLGDGTQHPKLHQEEGERKPDGVETLTAGPLEVYHLIHLM